VPLPRLRTWVAYGRSCSADTRVALAGFAADISGEDVMQLRDLGVGLYSIGENRQLLEAVSPIDLAVNIDPPDLSNYSKRIRKALGGAYEHIERGQWREGFEAACVALETNARAYLKNSVESGRISFRNISGSARTFTATRIEKMTLRRAQRCI
jgi:hypothetical protein